MSTARTVFVRTYGCQMNVYDSSLISQGLAATGFRAVATPEEAEWIVINTCSVRKKAEDKVFTDIGRFSRLRVGGQAPRLVVAGCVARHKPDDLLAASPTVALVMGPDAIGRLPELIEAYDVTGRAQVAVDIPPPDEAPFPSLDGPGPSPVRQVSAYVTVMRGCDRFCSYCIVPHVRGREASRPADEILREVRGLVASGVREVTLLGQNVNSYGRKPAQGIDFPALLDRVAAVDDLARLRFVTSHPHDCTEALMARFADLPTLCGYFHLPLQAGSDAVLARMNRRYTAADYLARVGFLRRVAPHVHLSTDMIVGFPGETDADFERTMEMVEALRFDSMFSFKYSPREGTRAAGFDDDVPAATKQARLERLQARQDAITQESLDAHAGQTVEVLVEGRSKRSSAHRMGRTPGNVVVNFTPPDAPCEPGALVDVEIERVHRHSLFGHARGVPR